MRKGLLASPEEKGHSEHLTGRVGGGSRTERGQSLLISVMRYLVALTTRGCGTRTGLWWEADILERWLLS